MNKRASNLAIWVELVLFLIVILAGMAVIGSDMNERYSKNYDLTLGLNLTSELNSLKALKVDAVNDSQGKSELSDYGILKLATAPKILMSTLTILWNFANGNFITQIIGAMELGTIGDILGIVFRILYVMGLVFILLKLVLRINV